MPVLTCPVAAVDADCFRAKNADVNFGFGTIQLQAGLVQSIRVQVHDVQIFWLADMTDPEVWAAIDKCRQAKHCPVQFNVRGEPGGHGSSVFLKTGVPRGTYRNEQFRNAPMPQVERIWKNMVDLADSGLLQQQAETDIEGIPLRRVFVNVLLTERFKGVSTRASSSRCRCMCSRSSDRQSSTEAKSHVLRNARPVVARFFIVD
jgi:hypothetical protein